MNALPETNSEEKPLNIDLNPKGKDHLNQPSIF